MNRSNRNLRTDGICMILCNLVVVLNLDRWFGKLWDWIKSIEKYKKCTEVCREVEYLLVL